MKKSKKFQSITNHILAMKFMSELIFIYPVILIMYGERGNVDAAGIGLILAVGYICSILFEIPTGVFSDRVARKYVILLALLTNGVGLATWLFFPGFIGYTVAAVIFALGFALESGSWQAYLYGVLPDNDKKSFGKFWARVSSMVMISFTSAYVLTSVIGIRYELLISLSIISVIAALAIGVTLPKDSIAASDQETKPKVFRSAVSHILGSKKLIKLLLSAVIVVGMAEVAIEYSALYYDQLGFETRYVPLLLSIGNIVGAILFWNLHRWEHILEKHKIALMGAGLALFVGSFYGGLYAAIAGMILFTRFLRLLQVQFESNIQHISSDESRATISSIGSFGSRLFAAMMALFIGIFATNDIIIDSMRAAFVITGIAFIVLHSLFKYRQKLLSQNTA